MCGCVKRKSEWEKERILRLFANSKNFYSNIAYTIDMAL